MSTGVMPPPTYRAASVPGAPALPQVNLLPPEVRAGRHLGRVKSWLGVVLLVTVLVAGLLIVWSMWTVNNAEAELAEVQDQNQQLVADQAKYAEVPQVLNRLDEFKESRALAMSTEVMWRPYLAAVAATAPAGVSFDTVSVTAATPITPAPAVTTNPLLAPNIGTLTFTARSLTLPDTATWMDGLADVDGLSDPWFTSAQVAEEDGSVYYQVAGTVQLTPEAYTQRFTVDAGPSAGAAEQEEN